MTAVLCWYHVVQHGSTCVDYIDVLDEVTELMNRLIITSYIKIILQNEKTVNIGYKYNNLIIVLYN